MYKTSYASYIRSVHITDLYSGYIFHNPPRNALNDANDGFLNRGHLVWVVGTGLYPAKKNVHWSQTKDHRNRDAINKATVLTDYTQMSRKRAVIVGGLSRSHSLSFLTPAFIPFPPINPMSWVRTAHCWWVRIFFVSFPFFFLKPELNV